MLHLQDKIDSTLMKELKKFELQKSIGTLSHWAIIKKVEGGVVADTYEAIDTTKSRDDPKYRVGIKMCEDQGQNEDELEIYRSLYSNEHGNIAFGTGTYVDTPDEKLTKKVYYAVNALKCEKCLF